MRWLDRCCPADSGARRVGSSAPATLVPRTGARRAVARLPGAARTATQRVTQVQTHAAARRWRCWRGRCPIRRATCRSARCRRRCRGAPRPTSASPAMAPWPVLGRQMFFDPFAAARRRAARARRLARLRARVGGDRDRRGRLPSPHRRRSGQRAARGVAGPGRETQPPCSRRSPRRRATPVEFAAPPEIRAMSLAHLRPQLRRDLLAAGGRDRIGPVRRGGQLSAQVLARRKEFGAARAPGPDAAPDASCWSLPKERWWTLAGALLGLVLGLAVSVVLVEVVNPQSFHWTMDLRCPARLAVLAPPSSVAGDAGRVAQRLEDPGGAGHGARREEDW